MRYNNLQGVLCDDWLQAKLVKSGRIIPAGPLNLWQEFIL